MFLFCSNYLWCSLEGLLCIGIRHETPRLLFRWNLEPFGLEHTLRGHTMWINALAFFDSNRRLISASADRTLKVWDVERGAELLTLRGHTDQVQTVAVFAGVVFAAHPSVRGASGCQGAQ